MSEKLINVSDWIIRHLITSKLKLKEWEDVSYLLYVNPKFDNKVETHG